MSTKKVKKAMIDKDLTITKLAKKTGYSRIHLSNVINGHFKSAKARGAIAEALGKKPERLWASA